ncbi:MAG: EVE domain-containing protein [Alphaproteobacteria bacterium]|nr:EVE domain-containing protein [Alphaproteobacteria bacterium]
MAHWLVKSEPSVYSWDQMVKDKRTFWSGVRNHQAAANMKAMKKGELALFYHSNEGKEIVGIVRVAKEYYPDHTDETGKFGMVDLEAVKPLKSAVTLTAIKEDARLKDFGLVRQGRLSVVAVGDAHWALLMKMAGEKA